MCNLYNVSSNAEAMRRDGPAHGRRPVSDEARRPGEIDEPRRAHAGLFHHDCEHPGCGRWGAFGFARNGNVKDTTWRCYEHRIIE